MELILIPTTRSRNRGMSRPARESRSALAAERGVETANQNGQQTHVLCHCESKHTGDDSGGDKRVCRIRMPQDVKEN